MITDVKETAVGYLSSDSYAVFSSNEQKWVNKIIKLQESHPDKVKIKYLPEDNNGMLLAHIPKSWFKISPPRQVNYTDEQRAAVAERLASGRKVKNSFELNRN
jgi:hypothetical protein